MLGNTMKTTISKLRKIIRTSLFEAKFTPHRALDREGMQIALGTHPVQHGHSEEDFNLVQDEMIDYVLYHEEDIIIDDLPADRFVDFFEDYYNGIATQEGLPSYSVEALQSAFDDLLDRGKLIVSPGGLVILPQ